MKIRISEAQIQAEFYHFCRVHSVPVLLELSTPIGRLDAAVMSPNLDALLAIVECKRGLFNPNSGQFRRYRSIGVPVFPLLEMAQAESLVLKIKAMALAGIEIDRVMAMQRLRQRRRRISRAERAVRNLEEDVNLKA